MAIDPDKQLPGGPETVNEEFFDALIRHQIFLLRTSGGIRNDITAILDATELDLAAQIKSRLGKGGTQLLGTRRLQLLLDSLKTTRLKAFEDVTELWIEQMVQLAQAEPEFVAGIARTVSPTTLDLFLPSKSLLRALVTSQPFEGKTLREWSRHIAATDIARINDQIKIGLVQGEGSAQIARRVVGTTVNRGRDGITELTRRQAAAITRTAVIHYSNQAKRQFYDANASLLTGEIYTATLDARTTPICRSLDGKQFPVGEGPIPPLHFNCRSVRVASFNGEAIGNRPQRQFTQRMLLREFAQKNGFKPPASRAGLPHGTKGAFDTFSRGRIRQLTGTIPAKVNYQTWLGRQSVAFQNDVLGVTKARLFRQGGLELDKFVNRAGDELNLSELARKNSEAFVAAGLDPEDFL
jgi:SPP1 gp7 family putative phage head morphogenesis protein